MKNEIVTEYRSMIRNQFLTRFELQAAVAMMGDNILFSQLLSRLTQAAIGAEVPDDEIIDELSLCLKQMRKYKKGGA
jgi:hypothetical protein